MIRQFDTEDMDKIFGTLFDSSPDIFFIYDSEGTILDYRASKLSELYVLPEAFVGKKVSQVLPPYVNSIFMKKIKEAIHDKKNASFLYDLEMPTGLMHYECRLNGVKGTDLAIAVIRNVTEEQEAIRRLEESEQRYRKLLEEAPFPVIVIRIEDERFRYLNQRAQKQLGFEKGVGIGLCVKDFYIHATERVRFSQMFRGQGFVSDFEMQLINGKKESFFALISASEIEFEGAPCVLLSINDITERKEVEIALEREKAILKEQNELVDLMFEQTQESIALYNPISRKFTSFNSSAYSKLGYTKEEFFKLQLDAMQNELKQSDIAKILERAQSGEQIRYETNHKCKNGDLQEALVTVNKIVHKAQPYICFIWTDVTEENRQNKKLKALSSAVEQSPVSIVTTDLNGVIEYANPAFEKLTGYSQEESVGLRMKVLKSGLSSEEVYKNFWQTLSSGNVWRGEWINKRKDGVLYHEYETITPIYNQKGQMINYLAIKEDISRQKQAEKDRIDREVLDASNRAKNNFLSRMSLEIRTPLNAVLGFAELLGKDTALTEKQSSYMHSILRSGEHLKKLIDDILDLSKAESGHTIVNCVNFNLHELIDDIAMMFQLRFIEKNIQLMVYKDQSLPHFVLGDEGKLRQILINLIGNALKFTEVGSVSLRTFAQKNPNNDSKKFTLSVVVEDTGPGISSEDQGQIFNSFYQNKDATSQSGTGLGLAITKNLVELLGGSIMVFSSIGVGSNFSFNLPMHESDRVVESYQKGVQVKSDKGPVRILIADDKVEECEKIKTLLASLGFLTQVVSNGQAVFDVLEKWEPQALLMDMKLPIMDGYETARRICARKEKVRPYILGLVESQVESDIYEAIHSGVNRCIAKPIKIDDLLEAFEEIPGISYIASLKDEK